MRTTFQKDIEQLKRQQEILAALNFYDGAIDGVWGPKSIAAMLAYEKDPLFKPGIPNHGMPLGDLKPFPINISTEILAGTKLILLTHSALKGAVQEVKPVKQEVKSIEPASITFKEAPNFAEEQVPTNP